jgi:hypothetical protein
VKVCGWRPHDGGAAHTGPAYANLQGRKPREVWRVRASDAMGIWAPAVCCDAYLGIDREGDEAVRSIAIGGSDVAQQGSNDTLDVRASQIIAGREPVKQKCSLSILPRSDLDHEVSILIVALDAAGR